MNVLITGTRVGIGKALAESFLEDNKVIGFSRGECSIKHPHYTHFKVDVRDEDGVIDAIRKIKKDFKRIDLLINNAGVASMNCFMLTPLDEVKRIFETNFQGAFILTREICKVMISQKPFGGRIINVSTVAVPLAIEGESIYAASKSAIEKFTQVAAKEVASYSITINCIGLPPIKTDLIKNVSQDKVKNILDRTAVKRHIEVVDIVKVINLLFSCETITGQTIYLGGI